jgi:hypothetical protein
MVGQADREGRVVVGALQLVAPGQHLGQHLVHALQRVVAQARVAGMAAAAGEAHRLAHHALVHAHRAQAGGLADDGVAAQRSAGLHQRAGAVHGRFLVGGGEDDQRLFQVRGGQPARGLDGDPQERLHVGGAEAIETTAVLAQLERVVLPQRGIEGYGIGVTGQHQPARTAAQRRDQVGLVRMPGNVEYLNPKAGIAEPARQQLQQRPVALVPAGVMLLTDGVAISPSSMVRSVGASVAGRWGMVGLRFGRFEISLAPRSI